MLRVLHIDTMKGWRGGERQACYLAQGLRELGYQVGFACQPGSRLQERLRGTGVRVHPTLFRFEADFTAAWRLSGLIRRHDYHVLHMHDSHAHWLGGCASRIAGRPLRVVSRRVDFSIHRHGFGLSIVKYRHFADAFVAVSEAVRAALIRDGVPGKMIHVVHSGVRMPLHVGRRVPLHCPPRSKKERSTLNRMLSANGTTTIVGAVGSLVGHKGHRYLIAAASELAQHLPNLRFVVLGEGKLRRDLESRIRGSGLSGKFFLPGHKPSASRLIRAFDVFVMPSLQEGLGTSVLDAMAAGVPVVATRAGGIPEVVEDFKTGLLAKPGDAHSLAAALERILRDRDLTDRLARSAREKVAARFTVGRMVVKTAQLYRKLLSERQ